MKCEFKFATIIRKTRQFLPSFLSQEESPGVGGGCGERDKYSDIGEPGGAQVAMYQAKAYHVDMV
jgi:hypothetical protein